MHEYKGRFGTQPPNARVRIVHTQASDCRARNPSAGMPSLIEGHRPRLDYRGFDPYRQALLARRTELSEPR